MNFPCSVCDIEPGSYKKITKLPAVEDPTKGERCTYDVTVPDDYVVAVDAPAIVCVFA